jgi:hypothetical protein
MESGAGIRMGHPAEELTDWYVRYGFHQTKETPSHAKHL